MYNRILVPVDRSAFAENALVHAVAVAKRSGGAIHLVMVHTSVRPEAVRPAPVVFETGFDSLLVREEEEYLEALARSLSADHGVNVNTMLLEGAVSNAISRHTREAGIDLVVMSTHGHGGLKRAWLGSNADRLLRRLRVPMLLVRPLDSITPVAAVESYRNVLIALDGSSIAEAALGAVAGLPFAEDATCTLLRIAVAPMLPTSPYVPDAARENRELTEERNEEAARYLEAIAPRAAEHWPVIDRHVVSAYRPAEAILEHADRLRADLIVIGTHGRARVARAVLGSVADKVIRGADVPVFVYPGRALAWERALANEFGQSASTA